jgi:transposase
MMSVIHTPSTERGAASLTAKRLNALSMTMFAIPNYWSRQGQVKCDTIGGMGAPRKADWREERRKRAWSLKEQGWQQKDIAVAWGVSEGAVSQWLKRGRAGGVEALNAHPPQGMSPRLTAEQKAQMPGLLAKGAQAYGFRGDVWTASRVAKVIDHIFGIRSHRDHVGRLLREAGWSRQQPLERATQRDEAAIKAWSEQRWPAIKKKPSRKRPPSSG